MERIMRRSRSSDSSLHYSKLSIYVLLILSFWVLILHHCDARKLSPATRASFPKRLTVKQHYTTMDQELAADDDLPLIMEDQEEETSNTQPYVSSPFSLPPFDSLPPNSFPAGDSPPYCLNPPAAGVVLPPSPATSNPGGGSGGTEPSPVPPSISIPSPPSFIIPSPPQVPILSPPLYSTGPPPSGDILPSPPSGDILPSPPSVFVPSPPIFEPPEVYPGPPPSPRTVSQGTLWCVVKPSVPDPIILEAMNYACGSGADCRAIQPNGACFDPNNLFAHASYAFNSYWQRTKVAGGTCSFGGTAILVTVDPSHDGCQFEYH